MEMQFLNKRELFDLKKERDIYLDSKEKFLKKLDQLKKSKNPDELKKLLGEKTEDQWKKYYDDYIKDLNEKIKQIEDKEAKFVNLNYNFNLERETKLKYLRETNIDKFDLKKVINKKEKIIKDEIIYTTYQASTFGSIANYFVENLTLSLTKQYPKFFNNLAYLITLGDLKVFSKTYFSIMIFSSFLSSLVSFFIYLIYTLLAEKNILIGIVQAIPLSFLIGLISLGGFYIYPYSLISARKKAIKNDLPFVIIHMAAIAGSGASPVSIFNLILNSGEYKGLEGEMKKIVNYINLFGYDLSTALKAVSLTTPSNAFKDLLTGITATTEIGGDLRSYLSGKASEALSSYRIERKKYVESLATYSDVYTGVLIAAPLLFMTTLAIINVIGGSVGDVSVRTISIIGTYFVIPFLNIVFIIFLSVVQPET